MRNGDNYKPLDLARSLSEVRARGRAAAAVRLGELMRAGPPDTALAPGENQERVVAIVLGAKGWFEEARRRGAGGVAPALPSQPGTPVEPEVAPSSDAELVKTLLTERRFGSRSGEANRHNRSP